MLCFREIWSAAKQKRAAHVSILLYMIHVFCVCMYVCNMYVCEHGVPQNIIIIINHHHHHHHDHDHDHHRHRHRHHHQQIFFFQIWNMMINNWIFWDSIFKQTVPVWPYVCGVCIYAYCRFHRYQDMQASNMCTFHCLIISHLTLQLLGTNNYVFFQGAVSQFPELFPMESKTCGIVRNTSNCCAWGQSLLE